MGEFLTYSVYNACLAIAAPAGAAWLRCRPRNRPVAARFHPNPPPHPAPPLWLHACSVGEVNTARPMLAALRERFTTSPLLLTASTIAGIQLARKQTNSGIAASWCPFDTKRALRPFLETAAPRALILIETEIWPNMLRESRRRNVPAIIVNARLSDKHIARYRRIAPFLRPVFAQIAAAGVQNETYAARFAELGVPETRIRVTGNTKFDAVATSAAPHTRRRLCAGLGWGPQTRLLVFGSTRPGDEALAAACWRELRDAIPSLRLVVAPRHLERADEAAAAFDTPPLRRSELVERRARPGNARVLLLDTLGELADFYAIADLAVIGGSFFPGVNGHNPLESAALGVPTIFGPCMSNFPEPARALLEAQGAVRVAAPDALPGKLAELLRDPALCRSIGTRGRKAILERQGAVARNVDLIAETLDTRASADAADSHAPAPA